MLEETFIAFRARAWTPNLRKRSGQGRQAPLRGLEVDLVLEEGLGVTLVEAKSGATVASDMLVPLNHLADPVADRFEEVSRVLGQRG